MHEPYPLRLGGISKETIWGGNKINSLFGGDTKATVGERWILSARSNEDCIILNGIFKGMTLTEYLDRFIPHLLPFPILIKFIDARDRLSVQVHPDDNVAQQLGDDTVGKTEMWHILEADEGATIVYGVKEGVSRDMIKAAVDEGRVESILNYVPVKAGETYFIPAGLVHAIGKGILLAEVQQNSDTTYRFYDYGRLDANGCLRQLHIDKALTAYKAISENELYSERYECGEYDALASCRYFKVFRFEINGSETVELGDSDFCSVVCISGNAVLEYKTGTESVTAGDSFFISGDLNSFTVMGNAILMISFS